MLERYAAEKVFFFTRLIDQCRSNVKVVCHFSRLLEALFSSGVKL